MAEKRKQFWTKRTDRDLLQILELVDVVGQNLISNDRRRQLSARFFSVVMLTFPPKCSGPFLINLIKMQISQCQS